MTNALRFFARCSIVVIGLVAILLPAPTAVHGQDVQSTALDTIPPVFVHTKDLNAAAIDATGVAITFFLPKAIDNVDGEVPVSCVPAPGFLFPLGKTQVVCQAHDAAGNTASVSFVIIVTDQTPPVISPAPDVVVDAVDGSGVTVDFAAPTATDNVDGGEAVSCDAASGSLFPVGTTVVTCHAADAAGNQANPISFNVVVNPPQTPTPTDPPTATEEPTATEQLGAIDSPTPTAPETATEDPPANETATATEAPSDKTENPQATKTPPVTKTPTTSTKPKTNKATPTPTPTVPPALELPWPPPDSFVLVTDGGPLGGLSAIWRNENYPITQEFGHTDFSVRHHRWYAYGAGYGLDGYEHPGIDIGMPAGTWLYSPVEGTVKVAGGVPYYTFYGNGQPGVGELLIETDDGDQVILGHMGLITVEQGQRVEVGQFVGLSGGDNGDHLHLETRERQWWGGTLIVDPRKSFLIQSLEDAARKNDLAKSSGKEPQRHGGG